MKDSYKRKAIFSGWFNPFHIGHAFVILESIKKTEELLVFVLAHPRTDSMPLASLDERRTIIKKWINKNKKKWENRNVEVYDGNETTPDNLFKRGEYAIKILGADRFRTQMSKRNFLELTNHIEEFIVVERPPFEVDRPMMDYCTRNKKTVTIIPASDNKAIAGAHSTNIRDSLFKNKTIRRMVPEYLEADTKKAYENVKPF